jgi:hypothetical protein
MKKLRIDIDTSVIGGCFDPEFQIWSEGLMHDFRQNQYVAVVSDITDAEISPAPDFVKVLYQELLGLPTELVKVDEEAASLVQRYMERSVFGQRFINDMLHCTCYYCRSRRARQLEI